MAAAMFFAALPCLAHGTTTFVYEGTLQNADGEAVTTGGTVRIEVRSPSSTDSCLLYAETHTIPASEKGYFSVIVGKTPETLNPAHTLEEALSNRTALTGDVGSCTSGIYTPTANDGRNLVIKFTPHGETTAIEFPAQALAASPYATQAKNVGGFSKDSLLRVEDAGIPGTAPALTSAQAAALTFIAGGTSNLYEKRGQLNGLVIPSLAANQALRWNGTAWEAFTPLTSYTETDPTVKPFAQTNLPTCAPGEVLTGNGTVLSCVSDATGTTPPNATTTTKGIVAVDATGGLAVSNGTIGLAGTGVTAGTFRKVVVDAFGRVTAGVALSSTDIPSLDASIISQGTFDAARLPAVTSSMITSVSGSVITSGTIGGTTAIVSSGSLSGNVLSGRTLKLRDSDDTNKITIQTPATGTLASDYTLTLPADDGTNGQILSTDGSGNLSWTAAGGLGTVTNVGLTLPNIFGVTGGPVTTSGTFTATLASQTQNTVWAAPNGTNGTPTFRALVATDVPALDAGKIATGTFTAAQIPFLDAAKIASGTLAAAQIPLLDAAKVTTGTFAAAQIPSLDAGKITSGTLATAQIPFLDAAKIATGTLAVPLTTSGTVVASALRLTASGGSATLKASAGATVTLTLPPDDGTANQILKTDGNGALSWTNDATGGLTSVGVTSPLSNTGTASAPVIAISAANSTTSGYLSGTDWTTFNNKLGSGLAVNRVFMGSGGGVATATYFGVGDLRKSDGTAQFASASCAASQTLTWSAVTDLFSCSNIAIANTQVSGLGTASTKNFGTSSGQLVELDSLGKIPLAVRSGTFSGARVSVSNNGEARYHLYNGGSVTEWVMGQKSQSDHDFKISKSVAGSETDIVDIDASGNVGIGTVDAEAKLHVVGTTILAPQTLIVVDEKAAGTGGGACYSALGFVTRTLNTVRKNSISNATVNTSLNRINLPAGTYEISASAPAYYVDLHRAKLRNVTDGTDVIWGTNEYVGAAVQTNSLIIGEFTISSPKSFEIQHRCTYGSIVNAGFGAPSGLGPEVYTTVKIVRTQ